jgi:hypothetical protein
MMSRSLPLLLFFLPLIPFVDKGYVGTMIKIQPIFIKGINESNQEITKESAFGAMGMFIFSFTLSTAYLCWRKFLGNDQNDECAIRARGYMRPLNLQHGSGSLVELPNSDTLVHSDSEEEEDNDHDQEEFQTVVN